MQDFEKQFTLAMLAYASTRDIDPGLVCAQSGFDLRAFQHNPKVRISAHQLESLWKNLVTTSDDTLFGLHFAESARLAALGVVGQIIQSSRNVIEALTHAGKLVPLVSELFRMQVEHAGNTVLVHLLADPSGKSDFPVTYKQMADYLAVFVIHELDGLLLRKIIPLAAEFPYDLLNRNEYARLMRCDVRHGKELIISLDGTSLEEVIISANHGLQQYLVETIGKVAADHNDQRNFSSKVFRYLLSNAYLFDASLESTAANFNVSARTLQRKLQEEGSSFLQIADSVRHHLAVNYLASGNHQVKDIAYMLGYNEQSALVRAFKRWTGKTPTQFIIAGTGNRVGDEPQTGSSK